MSHIVDLIVAAIPLHEVIVKCRDWLRSKLARSLPYAEATIGNAGFDAAGKVWATYSFTLSGEYHGDRSYFSYPKQAAKDMAEYSRELVGKKLPVHYQRANPDHSLILPDDWPAA